MFISHLKPVMNCRQVSVSRLAFELGVSENIIVKIQDGKYVPTLDMAIKIAMFLDASIFDLFVFT